VSRRLWNAKNRRTIEQEHAEKQRLAEISAQNARDAAQLRRNAVIDVMIDLASLTEKWAGSTELALSSPAERSQPPEAVHDGGKVLIVAQALARRDREGNPSWGGEDSWALMPEYRQADYIALVEAALEVVAKQRV
jgi:hypothetical protein